MTGNPESSPRGSVGGFGENRVEGGDGQKAILTSDNGPPEDKGGIVKKIFFCWGVGVLLPWNAICNEFDFFINEMPG